MMILLVLLALAIPAHGYVITQFPDGSDSIGIPEEPYTGACFIRAQEIDGAVSECAVNIRPGPLDCATQVRHTEAELPLPLPQVPARYWRHVATGWCLRVRRTDTGALFYPACHSEALLFPNPRRLMLDSECWYPKLPGDAPFEYVASEAPTTARSLLRPQTWLRPMKRYRAVQPGLAPDGTAPDFRRRPGRPGAYRYHQP